ncbi:MAG: peptidoglycan-binding domain-containing protein [Alphaproteobacteria bacterium]|nr:peptidoglycan-binding domain-containing protein [Alphaproteobacteria bacterium]
MTDDDRAKPTGTGGWEVEAGDSMASIADQTGHFWEKIWNDPANSELKTARQNPHVLMPGDKVTIPDLTAKSETRQTDLIYTFKRKGVPIQINFTVETQSGKPFPDKAYILKIGRRRYSGRTDSEGKLSQWVAPAAKSGTLTVELDTPGYPPLLEKTLNVGYLQPISSDAGIRARLKNLGYLTGMTNDQDTLGLQSAIKRFQVAKQLDITGVADDAFRDALLKEHGN